MDLPLVACVQKVRYSEIEDNSFLMEENTDQLHL